MQRYLTRLQEEKTPHERRQIAVRVAGAVTAVLFVGWLATLGVRVSTSEPKVADTSATNQMASIGSLIKSVPSFLYVATTTDRN